MALNHYKTTRALSGYRNEGSHDLAEMFAQVGFDPQASGAGFVLTLTDSHMVGNTANGYVTTAFSQPTIAAIRNAGHLGPVRIVHLGDMLTDFVSSFGNHPGDGAVEFGLKETTWFNSMMENLLQPFAPVALSLGNHDTPPRENGGIGAFCLANMTGFDALHHTFHCGGVRWVVLSADHGAGFVDGQFDLVDAEFAANNGEDMVMTIHQPGSGRPSDWHAMLEMWQHIPADLPGELLFLHGHTHRNLIQRQQKPGGKLVHRLTYGAAIPEAHPSGDAMNPVLGAIACRDGRIVEKFVCHCRSGYWYRLVPFQEFGITEPVWDYYGPLSSETRLADYRADSDLRPYLHNSPSASTFKDTGTWFSYVHDLRVKIPMATGGTRFYVCANVAPSKVDFSIDGLTWLPGTQESFIEKFAIMGIPEAARVGPDLYARIDLDGLHMSSWGILQ